MDIIAAYLIVMGLSISLSLLLTPVTIWLSERFNIVAQAGGRRLNEGDFRNVGKLGSVAVFGAFFITVIASQQLNVPRMDPNEDTRLLGLLLGGGLIFVVGILDDIFEFRAGILLLTQIASALIAIHFDIFIEFFNNPLTGQQTEPWPFAITVILSLLWITGITNTINWLDGADGLAPGVVFIACVILFINGAFQLDPPQHSVSLLPLALAGTLLGFLMYNSYPAKIFLGGGAYFLGFCLATLSIIGGAKMATILLVAGLPILDAAWQIANRALRGRSPFVGDRGHMHFRLLDMGFSQRQIVWGYYIFCAGFGTLTLVIESRLFKLVAFVAMAGLVALGFALLYWSAHRTEQEP